MTLRLRASEAAPGFWRNALLTCFIAVAAFFACSAQASAGSAGPLAEQMLLRLSEMPPGYVFGQNSFCAPIRAFPESEQGELYAIERKYHPYACHVEYERLFVLPGQASTVPIVSAFVVTTPAPEAARRLLGAAPELLENVLLLEEGFEEASPAPAIGEESRLLRTLMAQYRQRGFLSGSVLLWRQGSVLAGIYAAGATEARNDSAAETYARLHQAHVESPSIYRLGEANDVPVFLGNPYLRVPVYWLGRTFKPKGLKPSYFLNAYGRHELEGGLPGEQLVTYYAPGLFLHTWPPAAWRRFAETPLGRRQWSWRCTRSRRLPLAHGRAVIYASYRKGFGDSCPKHPPHHFSAHVFLPGAVIAIGPALCGTCQGDLYGYESWRGMEAVVRRLRPWKDPHQTGKPSRR